MTESRVAQPSQAAIEWAAQLWCRPENAHRVMDEKFAMSIAAAFDETAAPELLSAARGCLQRGAG